MASFILIVGGAFLAVLIFATLYKMREVRVASRWPSTTGKIVKSTVKRTKVKRLDGQTVGNFPLVVYEYEVAGKNYHNDRITIGEQAPDFMIEETLAKYPLESNVIVYYNPLNPKDAVLERDVPEVVQKGLKYAFVIFIGGPLIAACWFTQLPDYISRFLPNPQNSETVAYLASAGIFFGLLAFTNQKRISGSTGWPTVTGRLEKKDVVETDNMSVHHHSKKVYRSRVVYSYEVNGRRYISDRTDYGPTVSMSRPSMLSDPAPNQEKGSPVTVFYNPSNPAESVLNPAKVPWFLWIITAGLLIASARIAGFV